MARIRSIKPEFWDSPSTAKAELAARLTYIALWNWADDSGHGTANLKELEAFCFPNDDVSTLPKKDSSGTSGDSRGNSAHTCGTFRNFAEVLRNTAEAFGITFYEVSGRYYYRIDNFRQHQSKDFREKSKYPKVEDGQKVALTIDNGYTPMVDGDALNHAIADSPATVAEIPAHSAEKRTLEQGNRVIGEQGNRGTNDHLDDDRLPNPEPAKGKPSPKKNIYSPEFETWWKLYPNSSGKAAAATAWKKALKLMDGEELNNLTRHYARLVEARIVNPDYVPHGSTWLNGRRWEDGVMQQEPTQVQATAPGRLSNAEVARQLQERNAQDQAQQRELSNAEAMQAWLNNNTPKAIGF